MNWTCAISVLWKIVLNKFKIIIYLLYNLSICSLYNNVRSNCLIKLTETRCVCETQMPPIIANSKDVHGHKDKYLDTSRKILSQGMLMQYESSNIYLKIMKPWKGLITRNTHVKYQSSSTHCSKVMNKVSVFKKMGQIPRSMSQCKK